MSKSPSNSIKVLDKGYVRLVDVMGDDLTVVNAARVSFDKQSFELSERDRRLIKFLATHGHTSPFRHATMQFEVYAPLMVARQWWKYIVGSMHQDPMGAWNESSRRYVTEDVEFYLPGLDEYRSAPENKKQGSGKALPSNISKRIMYMLEGYQELGQLLYEWSMTLGLCAEQARLFLPSYGLYVRWYWTCSLQAVAHFLNQRVANDAQKEIQRYALAVYRLIKPYFEHSLTELLENDPELHDEWAD